MSCRDERLTTRTAIPELSIAEIRKLWIDSDDPVEDATLQALARDPRKGVRRIADSLERRRRERDQESARLDQLLALERGYWELGLTRIAGVDEVGAGPLAGPVVAGAVILPARMRIDRVDDSKRLDARTRSRLDIEIRERAICLAIGEASVEEIDRINIRQATLLAMRRALDALEVEPEQVLIDARQLENLPWPQEAVIHGDARVHCIACASIVAKVHRDRLMDRCDATHPGYGFAEHKGYGTPEHLRALRSRGPCALHRSSFHWPGKELPLFPQSHS